MVKHQHFFIVVLDGDTFWHLQKFLQCIKYIILENSSPLQVSFPLFPSNAGIISTGIILIFTYVCTQSLYYFSPSHTFPYLLLP
jgi:hypothetical protein